MDTAIDREYLPAVIRAAAQVGLSYRQVAGVDMLVEALQPRARSAIHLVFLREKVRQEYLEVVPASPPTRTREGILLAPVEDLQLPDTLKERLRDVRSRE